MTSPAISPAVEFYFDFSSPHGYVARGAFGSPYFIVDSEPFRGSDRLDRLERRIATGGW